MNETAYTVRIQNQTFTLSKSQITFDSPNYFSTCFLGDFYEAQTRAVEIHRKSDMFPLIQEYLCGYMVLPISESSIPKGMTPTQAITNLKADAMFYQLEGLVAQCNEYLGPVKKGLPASYRYLLVGWEVTKEKESADISNFDIKDFKLPTARQMGWHIYVTGQELEKMAMKNVMTREEFLKDGIDGVGAMAAVTCVAEKILPKDGRRRWVVGVHVNRFDDKGKEEEGEEDEEDEDEEEEDDGGSDGDAWVDEDEQDAYSGFDGEVIVILLEE